MIDKKVITSYAQFSEDLILLALLHDVDKGYYVDIGANYPTIDSVTKLFYDRGWNGVNIEPLKELHDQIEGERPRDVNLNIGIGSKNEEKFFYENLEESGHSSFLEAQAGDKGVSLSKKKMTVKRLDGVLDEYAKNTHIHFMKIDVEGYEAEVIAGNNWKKFRPEILCIEANHVKDNWRKTLLENDYKLFISDGLNEYYVANESWGRTAGYEERAVLTSYHSLKQHRAESWAEDSKMLKTLTDLNEEKEQLIQHLNSEISNLSSLSMKNTGLARRIKIAIVGLTVDWYRYQKDK